VTALPTRDQLTETSRGPLTDQQETAWTACLAAVSAINSVLPGGWKTTDSQGETYWRSGHGSHRTAALLDPSNPTVVGCDYTVYLPSGPQLHEIRVRIRDAS
jgi:hypothetical protein